METWFFFSLKLVYLFPSPRTQVEHVKLHYGKGLHLFFFMVFMFILFTVPELISQSKQTDFMQLASFKGQIFINTNNLPPISLSLYWAAYLIWYYD